MTTQTQNDVQKTPGQNGARSYSGVQTYQGGCSCGAVRYEADLDLSNASRCNCTFCTKYGTTGTLIKPAAFRLLAGKEQLSQYGREGTPNQRSFCKRCGVHCFSEGDLPELGGAFCSVNINTLDDVDPTHLTIGYWDGRNDNWQAGLRPSPWPFKS